MSFRGRGFLGAQNYPPAASKFLSVAGGSFTTSEKRALAYLVDGLTDLGIGAVGSNFLIYPFIGGTAARHALNLFYPASSSLNLTWVGSPTQDSSGTTFNGTTQYGMLPSLAIYPLTPNLTTANISMGFNTTGMGTGTYIPMGYAMNAATQTKTYSTAGSFTFNPNTEAPGITSFTITAYGGGGAGGGSNGTTSNRPGGGGAGGGYATRTVTITKAQGATDISITVGQGGTANTGAAGGAGGDTTVSHPNIVTTTAKGGPGGNVNTATLPGAAVAGAAGNAGTTTFTGGTGNAGGANVGFGGGGGGSSAGTAANGNTGSTPVSTAGGAGGTAPTGGVAGGAGGTGAVGAAGVAGNPGTAGGGGGGGAGATSAGNNRAGGTGGDGKVTISWTPATQKRNSMSIFNSGVSNNHIFNADVGGDATSRFSYQSTPSNIQGLRVGSRRGNAGTSADMGFYVNNNAGSAINGPAVMSTTSFDPTPLWYIGGVNNWAAASGVGNSLANAYSGTLNFAFLGPGLTDAQLQALYTLVPAYNTILGR